MNQNEIDQNCRSPEDKAIQNLLESNPQCSAQWDTTKFLLKASNKSHFLIRNSKNFQRSRKNSLLHQQFPSANSSIFSEAKNPFPKMVKSKSFIESNSPKNYNQKPSQVGFYKRYKQYQTSRGQDLKIAAYNTQYKWVALEKKSKGFQVSMSSVRVDSFCPQSNTEQAINFNNFIGSSTPKNVKIRQFISKMKKAKKQSNGQLGKYQSFPNFTNSNDQSHRSERTGDTKKTAQNFFRYSPRKIRQSQKPLRASKIEPVNAQIVGLSYFKHC